MFVHIFFHGLQKWERTDLFMNQAWKQWNPLSEAQTIGVFQLRNQSPVVVTCYYI